MKLCMLAPEFLPIWGGVGTYTVELIRHLPKNIEIHVVTPRRERLGNSKVKTSDYRFEDHFPDNVHVHLVGSAYDTFIYNARFQYSCFRFVPRLVKEEKIDLIHTHTAHMPDLLLQFRHLKVPVVTTVHTTIVGQRQGSRESGMALRDLDFSEKATFFGYPILRLAEQLFFSCQKRRFISVSNWMREQLVQRFPNLRTENIRVIHNSVDTSVFTPGKDDRERVTILFTGRLIAAKGLVYLVDAIPKILRSYPDTLFTFVGPGNPAPYQARLNRLGVSSKNLLFLGYFKDRKELIDSYRNCTLFVAPTLYENLPIRILEAMACAKPTIATNICAIPEAIRSGREGILVPPRSSEALVRAIEDLLRDRERRMNIGRRARQTVVEKFDCNTAAQKTANFYEEVLSSQVME